MLTVGSLFSGIGGLDLGLEWAGMKVVWQCEQDEFCRRVLAKHWPGIPCIKDVRDVRRDTVEPVDVIVGGFPCQPHSLAGKRKGAGDDRDLWPEFRRVVAELKPTWVVGENVPGIYGAFLDGVLADLEGLGYRALVFEIPACAVDAPHRRARVFIVAHADERTRERRITQPTLRNVPRSDGESVAHADVALAGDRGLQRGGELGRSGGDSQLGELADAGGERRQQDARSAPCDEGEDARWGSQGDHLFAGHGEGVGLADCDGVRSQDERRQAAGGRDADGCGEPGGVGDATRQREHGGGKPGSGRGRQPANASDMGHPESIGREWRQDSENGGRRQCPPRHPSPWSAAEWIVCGDGKARRVKPGLRLLAHGISGRVDKLRALGNAVVPQVAEVIGRMIVATKEGDTWHDNG